MVGFWLELLWYRASVSSDPFWRIEHTRTIFALIGAGIAILLAWPLQWLTAFQPVTTTTLVSLFSISALCGAVWGLGAWEFVNLVSGNVDGDELFNLVFRGIRWLGLS